MCKRNLEGKGLVNSNVDFAGLGQRPRRQRNG